MKAHLNPFAPNRVQRLLPFDPLLAGSSWDSIESDWEQLDRRAAVIGHHGSGKTTFLETFRTRLEKDWQIVFARKLCFARAVFGAMASGRHGSLG